MTQIQTHPVAALFPMMAGADFTALVEDVKAHGLLQPIMLHRDGSILDGRNRYKACEDAGVEARFQTYQGPDAHVPNFVASMNLRRRHIGEKERAFIAAELANLTRGNPQLHPPGGIDPLVSRAEAAAVMQVTPRSVERARAVAKHAPDLKAKVLGGEISMTAAAKEAGRRAAAEAKKETQRVEAVKRGGEALRKAREAERVRIVATAKRKLEAWLLAYGEVKDIKATVGHVRLALASMEE